MKSNPTGDGDLAVRLARHLHKNREERWAAAVRAAKYYKVNPDDVFGEMGDGKYDQRKVPGR